MGATDLPQFVEAGALIALLVLAVDFGRAAIARRIAPRRESDVNGRIADLERRATEHEKADAVQDARLDAVERDAARLFDDRERGRR